MASAKRLRLNDYYSYGMLETVRQFSYESFRFGFNGKENDNEVINFSRWQDYGMREYRPDLGRFISVDPLLKKYPMLSPYQFASCSPIGGIDIDGLELQPLSSAMYQERFTFHPAFSILDEIFIVDVVMKNVPDHYIDDDPRTDVGPYGHDITYEGPIVAQTGTEVSEADNEHKKQTSFDVKETKYKIKGDNFGLRMVYHTETENDKAEQMDGYAELLLMAEGVADYFHDKPEWLAQSKERKQREYFYQATNYVNFYSENGQLDKVGGSMFKSGQPKADLINYINDGTLPVIQKNLTGEDLKKAQEYNTELIRVGNIILKANNIPIEVSNTEH